MQAAVRARRLRRAEGVLGCADQMWGAGGPIALLALEAKIVLPLAHRIVLDYAVRTLDALHLAVATTTTTDLAAGEPVEFITRDEQQAVAAAALGLTVR